MPRLARDVMRPVGFTFKESDDAWTAARRLFENGQTGAPVLDGSGRLCGVLSQSDVAAHLKSHAQRAADFYGEPDRDPAPARRPSTVGQLMSRVIVHVPDDMELDEVERHMLRRRVQRVLVTRGDQVVGVITAVDLFHPR